MPPHQPGSSSVAELHDALHEGCDATLGLRVRVRRDALLESPGEVHGREAREEGDDEAGSHLPIGESRLRRRGHDEVPLLLELAAGDRTKVGEEVNSMTAATAAV